MTRDGTRCIQRILKTLISLLSRFYLWIIEVYTRLCYMILKPGREGIIHFDEKGGLKFFNGKSSGELLLCTFYASIHFIRALLEYNKITIISPYLFKIIGLNFALLFFIELMSRFFPPGFLYIYFAKIELFIIPAFFFFFFLRIVFISSVHRFAFSFLSHENWRLSCYWND